jgi:hypothetical protein
MRQTLLLWQMARHAEFGAVDVAATCTSSRRRTANCERASRHPRLAGAESMSAAWQSVLAFTPSATGS